MSVTLQEALVNAVTLDSFGRERVAHPEDDGRITNTA